MFPIPWNKAFRKKDGTLVNMEDLGGGGGSDIPEYSEADAGKVLGVTEEGTLAWMEIANTFGITVSNISRLYPISTTEEVNNVN